MEIIISFASSSHAFLTHSKNTMAKRKSFSKNMFLKYFKILCKSSELQKFVSEIFQFNEYIKFRLELKNASKIISQLPEKLPQSKWHEPFSELFWDCLDLYLLL